MVLLYSEACYKSNEGFKLFGGGFLNPPNINANRNNVFTFSFKIQSNKLGNQIRLSPPQVGA